MIKHRHRQQLLRQETTSLQQTALQLRASRQRKAVHVAQVPIHACKNMWCTAYANHHDAGPDSSMIDLLFVPALRRYFDANVQELGPVCFYCGLRGHKARDCTNQRKELPCALCAQYGHNKSHCPSCKSTVTCILTQVSCETCVTACSNNVHVSIHHLTL